MSSLARAAHVEPTSLLVEAFAESVSPATLKFVQGQPVETLTIGTDGLWRIVARGVADVHAAAKVVPPRYTDMRSAMRQIASEHQHLWTAMQKLKHTSAEIARASKFIIQGHADQVNMLAGRNQHDTWNNDTVKHVSALQKQLERARAELRV